MVFLILEGDDIVLMDKVVALVRADGETAIIMRDGAVKPAGFTPITISKRSDKFWRAAPRPRD